MPLVGGQIGGANGDLEHFIYQLKGGGAGVWRGVGDECAVEEQASPTLYVDVAAGSLQVADRLVRPIATSVGPFTVPTGGSSGDLRRIDLVQYTYGTGWNIKEGTEDASPSAPSADANSIVRAHVYCRNGMGTVLDADDSNNGYIDMDPGEFV